MMGSYQSFQKPVYQTLLQQHEQTSMFQQIAEDLTEALV